MQSGLLAQQAFWQSVRVWHGSAKSWSFLGVALWATVALAFLWVRRNLVVHTETGIVLVKKLCRK